MTPIQEMIAFINEDLEIKGISLVKRAKLEKVKKKAESLLQTEKEWAEKVWEAGVKKQWNDEFGVVPNPAPDFNTFYSQYNQEK